MYTVYPNWEIFRNLTLTLEFFQKYILLMKITKMGENNVINW